jgi:hypothetical protein
MENNAGLGSPQEESQGARLSTQLRNPVEEEFDKHGLLANVNEGGYFS